MGEFRSGYVSIIGRPNVGKSTLLNALLGQKVSIVTSRPQTTRNRIIGIKSLPNAQVIFIDTPGIHTPRSKMGQFMLREALRSIRDVDVVLLMVEPRPPGAQELGLLQRLRKAAKPVFLLINKIDKVKKPTLLPVIDAYAKEFDFAHILPVSALKGEGLGELLELLLRHLPPGPRYYPEELVTDQLERFMVAEIVREKVMEATREEVPHAVAVEVLRWEEPPGGPVRIEANIWVERPGQKGIIIGKGGQRLKAIGTKAREEIEGLLNARVFLQLWVKLKQKWRSDEQALSELGLK